LAFARLDFCLGTDFWPNAECWLLTASLPKGIGCPESYFCFHSAREYAARMGVSVSVLASGSRGNSTIVRSSSTRILVDAGISCRETFKRMKAAGDDPHSLSAIVITHEHTDHVSGLLVLARKLKVPVYMTGATHQAWSRSMRDDAGERPQLERLEFFSSGHSFHIGDIGITPFTIPHDAADPVGFTFRAEGIKIAIATDLGRLLANVKDNLRACDVLSNEKLAEFFATGYDGHASYIVLAHLSELNNHPECALREAEKALAGRRTLLQNRVMLAAQTEPMQPIRL
jgi:phosphoribosyl 1,2-cyclic phosphodiesterase